MEPPITLPGSLGIVRGIFLWMEADPFPDALYRFSFGQAGPYSLGIHDGFKFCVFLRA